MSGHGKGGTAWTDCPKAKEIKTERNITGYGSEPAVVTCGSSFIGEEAKGVEELH